jgi:hypothetical protein
MRVEWVHPSWRDLVIGRLKSDARARREFIQRAGVHGAVLALSTAGGSAGERRLPLIGADEDWDALTDRLYRLIPEIEPAELVMVLTALAETIDDLGGTEAVGEARALARAALSRATSLWDAAHAPIPLLALDAWVALARRIKPRPSLPDLSITWVELLPARAPELDDGGSLERFAEWLWLCQLLSGYDPEQEDEFGFGSEHLDLLLRFQGKVGRWATTLDARSLQSTTLDLVLRALESIALLEPALQRSSREIAYMLTIDTSVPPEPGAPPPPPRTQSEAFDVRRVLEDL